jgi:hypothetical protein
MLWELQVQALDYRMHFIIADTQIALSVTGVVELVHDYG